MTLKNSNLEKHYKFDKLINLTCLVIIYKIFKNRIHLFVSKIYKLTKITKIRLTKTRFYVRIKQTEESLASKTELANTLYSGNKNKKKEKKTSNI